MYDHTLYHISGHIFFSKIIQHKNLAYFTRFYFCMSGINQKRISHQTVAAKFLAYMYSLYPWNWFFWMGMPNKNKLEDCKVDQEK